MENNVKKTNSKAGTKIKAKPVQQKEIGIDVNSTLQKELIDSAVNSSISMSELENFTNVAQTREQIYKLIDSMAQDSTISSILETYSEDAVEINDAGKVVWCESKDESITKYVNFLLESINVDKHAFKWIHSLIKYGDLYLRLYRESDYGDDILFGKSDDKQHKSNNNVLNEDVKIVLHQDNDYYVPYVEMVSNPGEMFDLTRFGKTMGYVCAPVLTTSPVSISSVMQSSSILQYNLKKKDVEVYQPTDFVHASLEDTSSRVPEQVTITFDDNDSKSVTYKVKRGQSLLTDVFKIWRELSLLENSVILNRITKSSIVRIISSEIGDMPKSQIGAHLNSIKNLIEQKTALNVGNEMTEYTNPGPIENNIYVATRGGIGAITTSQIGGEVDPKPLTDLDWFNNKFFAALRVPKQFFGFTDDAAGFNGGSSLSIISSRYGKAVKRIQNTFIQCITDVINLFLLNRGLTTYINNFTIKMNTPITQEQIDRQNNQSNQIRNITDIMNTLTEVKNSSIKLSILKSLLSTSINNVEVISKIQEQINQLEAEEREATSKDTASKKRDDNNKEDNTDNIDVDINDNEEIINEPQSSEDSTTKSDEQDDEIESIKIDDDSYLPSPEELGINLSTNK